jgi:hypothetical protein|tara:strand:+ start:95 stop:313 length:219 start_codon:yes stop_codon:yes gene_type:complete
MADQQEVSKSLEDQLQDQRKNLETNIRDTERQLATQKEQYLKVLGALEFAAIQREQAVTSTDDPVAETVMNS